MGRFASTITYYDNARPPYGAVFFATVGQQLGFDRSQRLLDVGAGPGILAIGFAPYCREVVGVDPEPAMVEAALAAAERVGATVRFIEGRFMKSAMREKLAPFAAAGMIEDIVEARAEVFERAEKH
ncbi:MAG TPA: class I SAM-dependent methyltransferase [Roseiarcus sp.]|jgi:predicted RNA methylase